MDMPILKCVKILTFAPFLVYKLFENEHYSVRICYFFLLLHFLQHYMNLPV